LDARRSIRPFIDAIRDLFRRHGGCFIHLRTMKELRMNERWLQVAGCVGMMVAGALSQGCAAEETSAPETDEHIGTQASAFKLNPQLGKGDGTATVVYTDVAFKGVAKPVIDVTGAECGNAAQYYGGDGSHSGGQPYTIQANSQSPGLMKATNGKSYGVYFQRCTWEDTGRHMTGYLMPKSDGVAPVAFLLRKTAKAKAAAEMVGYDTPSDGTTDGLELTANYTNRTNGSSANPVAIDSNFGIIANGMADLRFKYNGTLYANMFSTYGEAYGLNFNGMSDGYGAARSEDNLYINAGASIYKVTVGGNKVPARFGPDVIETYTGSNIWVVKKDSDIKWRPGLPPDAQAQVCDMSCSVSQCQQGSCTAGNGTVISWGQFNQ
jgi:hypothetical protein